MKIEKFTHPLIDELFKLYGKEAEEKALELNNIIAAEFKWAIDFGYKQVKCATQYPNRERVTFSKSYNNYRFYFDVRSLNLGLSFDYGDTLLFFNGDGEYDKQIELDYRLHINNTEGIKLAEDLLVKRFLNEVDKLFRKSTTPTLKG